MSALSKRYPPNDPSEWLNRATSNLIRAKNRIAGVYLEDLCFDAQQAAEKAIKAVLIQLEVEYPYVHDLADLLTLVEKAGTEVPASVKQASRLTRYAVVARYPSAFEPVIEEEYEQALPIAETTVRWATEFLCGEEHQKTP